MECEKCQMSFASKFNLKRHIERKHMEVLNKKPRIQTPQKTVKNCEICKKDIPEANWYQHLRASSHKEKIINANDEYFSTITSCFKNRIETLVYKNQDKTNLLVENFLKEVQNRLSVRIKNYLCIHNAIKFNIELFASYVQVSKVEGYEPIVEEKSFQTKMVAIFNDTELNDVYMNKISKILRRMEEFQERDSGWTLVSLNRLEINVNKYAPLKGSTYIPLPNHLKRKEACINVQNKDEYCFKWSIISALSSVKKDGQQTYVYRIADISTSKISLNDWNLNFHGLEFPLQMQDIKKFEELNPMLSINVFGYDEKHKLVIGPYYKTREIGEHHINLLYIQNDLTGNGHYIWIKNISRLVRSQLTSDCRKVYICNYCLQHFRNEEKLKSHAKECSKTVSCLPNGKEATLKFEHYERKIDVPFVIYADFECILEDVNTSNNLGNTQSTSFMQKHVPFAFSYYIKCSFSDKPNKLVSYKGLDAPAKFIEYLTTDVTNLYQNYLKIKKPMDSLTQYEKDNFKSNNTCHICETEIIVEENKPKVRDHCHMTGKYRGPAHYDCNLQYTIPNFIPIIFHNFSKYDCHLFVKELNYFDNGEKPIKVIPLNKELYISMTKTITVDKSDEIKPKNIHLRFIDSLRFMPASLDSLVKNLSNDDLKIVKSEYTNKDEFNLLVRKGVFPYEYLSSVNKLQETSLPKIEDFFNKLTDSACSPEDYEHAKKVWSTFKCKTISDYLSLYLKTDVLLLADVFENFRQICKTIYKLDPAHYYTSPGLSWDAMLKITNINLELLTDIEKVLFIQRGIRGGIVQCSQRHSKANNKYMSDFNMELPSKYLMYLDANNLYGWAMSQLLPEGKFEWVEDISNFDLESMSSDSEVGYILEVDLTYSKNIHDRHNDLPFCCENKKTPHAKQTKLVTDLNDKSHYVIHYQNLKQCLKHGLKLEKIHKILKFKQSPWLKTYIDLNNHHRTLAKTKFEKDFFKLLNNSVYGKTMENVDKRKDVKIVSKWENVGKRLGARSLIARPNFNSASIFSENMIAIQLDRTHSLYNKPIYLGFVVLELSKWKMYDFHYDYMLPKYEENIKLNYMDTDSFIYTIQTEDFYKDIKNDIDEHFDTSEYDASNPYNIPQKNKKVLGLMKDENNGNIMREFVGLRSKMYCIDLDNENCIKKAKGVKRNVTEKLTLSDYKNCLYSDKITYGDQRSFRSKLHELYTIHLHKICLSNLDDKRCIGDDKFSTLAWGHYKLSNNKSNIS